LPPSGVGAGASLFSTPSRPAVMSVASLV
jgi:hypothetical protein